jgi:two-component system, chemotaxis family, sensor kinase CheA
MPATVELSDVIEKSASAAMEADPGDLRVVGELHTHLLAVCELAASEEPVRASAGKAAKLVEQIVMGEVKDAAATLADVRRMIGEIQQLTSGAKPTLAPSPEASPQEEQTIKEEDLVLAAEFIGEATGHMDSAEASLLAMEEEPGSQEHVNAVFRGFHTIKGVAGFLNFRQIGSLAHAAENLLDRARKGLAKLDSGNLDVVLSAVDMMRQLTADVDRAVKSDRVLPAKAGLEAMLRGLAAAAGEGAAAVSTASAPAAAVPAKAPPAQAAAPTQAKAVDAAQTAATDTTVKVSTERLDSLIDTVGELVIAQAMVSQDVLSAGPAASAQGAQRLTRNMSHLGKITRSLQDLSMAMRMVPIHAVFQKMARLARDVARKAGKEIDFVQVGGDTELDRNVVEAVSDPLVHMVRNAIDHGIEPPEQREKAGKPRTGRVQLKASHHSGNVVIEITDDGRGLSKSKILAKAVSCGIVKEGQEMSDEETFHLIFHAGLSTAEKITDISGRGVGMDVARKNVEALRGRIDISSQEGHGSLFTIRLPLTLAVIDGLVVKVGAQRYIIPITSIEQSLRPRADQLSTVQNKGEFCLIRERILPLVRLNRLFSIPGAAQDPTQALVVIVCADQRCCCLLVDELLGQQQVVIKSLGERFGRVPGISGGAILGDGNVSLIVDVSGLVNLAKTA